MPTLEIGCDESGYEGERLIGTTTDVFAHAGVRLDIDTAGACMRELRNRIRSPATEYKATHLLRQKHRAVLTWLLGPAAPLLGNAHVYLVDKTYFALSKVVDLLLGKAGAPVRPGVAPDQAIRSIAVTLYRDGPRAYGPQPWTAFLVATNDLMRTKDRQDVTTTVASFCRAVDVLCEAGAAGRVGEVVALLGPARSRAEELRLRLRAEPAAIPPLDPLMPAIVRAVGYWGGGGRPVAIVHDRQTTLPEDRIAQLKEASEPAGRLASLTLVDSYSDPRVQLADVLAGVAARRIAADELHDRGDGELTALLRPYLDTGSVWGDDRSWSRLAQGAD